jgi:hypothetical protein
MRELIHLLWCIFSRIVGLILFIIFCGWLYYMAYTGYIELGVNAYSEIKARVK